MNPQRPVAVAADSLPDRAGSAYPSPFDEPCNPRSKRALGDPFGLTDFGVNILTVPPGSWSSQRHAHSHEDEWIYVLSGEPTLVTDAGETTLKPGMCAGFPAGETNGHHLVNNTDSPVTCIEVGSRNADDDAVYSDIDMQLRQRSRGGTYSHKDGTPYPKR